MRNQFTAETQSSQRIELPMRAKSFTAEDAEYAEKILSWFSDTPAAMRLKLGLVVRDKDPVFSASSASLR